MWKKVIRETTVQNTILRNGLRLFQEHSWHQNKDSRTLLEISGQLHKVMQLHLNTKNLVVGVPGYGKEVTLLEVSEQDFVPHYHQIKQVHESNEGYFIRLKSI